MTRRIYNVCIVGAGLTGRSAAFHLAQAGITNVCGVSHRNSNDDLLSTSSAIPRLTRALGGMPDNITRLDVARGSRIADGVWKFGYTALEHLIDHCRNAHIPLERNDHIRIASAPMEEHEVTIAAQTLTDFGLNCRLGYLQEVAPGCRLNHRTQVEPQQSAVIDLDTLMQNLGDICHRDEVQAIIPHSSFVEVQTQSERFDAEFVVIAAHTQIGKLLPAAKDWLVPYSDECHLFEGDFSSVPIPNGATVTWNFGYNSLTRLSAQQIAMTGARYLRPDAGTGQITSSLHAPCLARLRLDFSEMFPTAQLGAPTRSTAFTEIRPCDELPLIGPVPGIERILIASGYMGYGLPLGFLAGKCLADIIAQGRSDDLPDILLPRRLRAMDGT